MDEEAERKAQEKRFVLLCSTEPTPLAFNVLIINTTTAAAVPWYFSRSVIFFRRAMIEDQRRAEEESLRHKQEVVAKRREKREHVIEETLQTERDFLRSISICFDVFHDPSKGHSSIVSMFEKLQLLAVTQIQVYKVSTVMNANLIIFGHRTFVCDSRRSWTCGSCLATSSK